MTIFKPKSKLLPCLGEGCDRKFLTDARYRFCPDCRRYQQYLRSQGEGHEEILYTIGEMHGSNSD